MFKIGKAPSPHSDPVEHADYLEIECLRKSDRNASGGDLAAALGRLEDDLPEDRTAADVTMENTVDAAFAELQLRTEHSGRGPYSYPYQVNAETKLLEFIGRKGQCELYLFLLVATRMNMQAEKVQADIDGTGLFEEICCEVAKRYWGERTDGLVFGTARRREGSEVGAFPDAVNALCKHMGEGVSFFSHSGARPTAQDGNLDIVIWKRFADQRQGQLIGFGQCKTGTHWEAGTFEMVPEGFCQKWVRTAPAVKPVRLFFMTSRPRSTHWYDTCVNAGIVFERCRILDYAPRMRTLKKRWEQWTRTALASKGIPEP